MKKILVLIMTLALLGGFYPTNAFAKENPYVRHVKNLRENFQNATEKEYINQEDGRVEMYYIDCKIPKVDDPIDLDEYGYCKDTCKSVIEIYTAFFRKDGGLDFYEYKTICLDCNKTSSHAILEEGISVNQKRFAKLTKYTHNKMLKTLKERRKELINLGLNERNFTKEFIVCDENGIVEEDLYISNPEDNLNVSGICSDGLHKVVSYYTYQDGRLVCVSKCFKCLQKNVKEVSKIKDGMNILGSCDTEMEISKVEGKENTGIKVIIATAISILLIIILLSLKK